MNKQNYTAAILMVVLGFIIGAGSFIVSHQNPVKTVASDEYTYTDNWETFTNEKDGYTIKYPKGFSVENDHTLKNFATKDFDKASTTQVLIQINKVPYDEKVSKATFAQDVKVYYPKAKNVPDPEPVQLGSNITESHFVYDLGVNTSGTIFYSTTDDANFYSLVVYEPGYSHNKELVENILKTFSLSR